MANQWWQKKQEGLANNPLEPEEEERTLEDIKEDRYHNDKARDKGEISQQDWLKKDKLLDQEREEMLGGRMPTLLHDYERGIASETDLAIELEVMNIDRQLAEAEGENSNDLKKTIDKFVDRKKIWPVRKKMSHSLTEEFCNTASEEDASHELGTFRHGL